MTFDPMQFFRWLSPLLLALLAPFGHSVQSSGDAQSIEVAARYQDTYITFEELDDLLIARHVNSKLGRETRLFILKLKLVDALAKEVGMVATEQEIQTMLDEVEQGVRASGSARNIDEYLRSQGVPRVEFIESLRLAVLQTKLARRGLGIPPGQPVSGEQQELWLDARISERELKEFPAPWNDGVVLTNGNVTLLREDYLPFLRKRMDPDVVTDMLVDLLRVKRMRARMPDLDPKTLAQAVTTEIAKRAEEVGKDPKYKGLTYERLLASQGILFEAWPRDPNVMKAVLARLWVQRNHDDDSLRAVYENERDYFDGEFGEALEAYVVYLRAAEFPNQLIKLDHDAAEKKLLEVAASISEFADFKNAVGLHSEDRASRERQGFLGWVTRSGKSGPSPARGALFNALDSEHFKPTDPSDSLTRLTGPVRTTSGVLLLWIGNRRPKPSWTTMMLYVHRTLQERFVNESMDLAQINTYLQTQ